MPRSRSTVVLAGAALTVTALTACAVRPEAVTDPQQALAGSLTGVTAGRYSYDITFPLAHLTGAIDRADHQARWTSTMDDSPGRVITQDLVIGEDMYVTESDGGGLGDGSWKHFDLTRDRSGAIHSPRWPFSAPCSRR